MKRILLLLTILFSLQISAIASDAKDAKFDAGKMIMEHIGDDHSWHLFTYKDKHVTIPLPVILLNDGKVDIFMSSRFEHGHASYKGYKIGSLEEDGETAKGKIICVDQEGKWTGKTPYDFSITKNVFMMFIVSGIIIAVVFRAKSIAKKRVGKAPKGTQTIVEFIILFIRDDIAIPSIGLKRHGKFMTYLLTAFCFIFLSNIMGLFPFFPGGANLTGNIAVTLVLAVFTFIITQFSANKDYFKHIINMPGVPWWLKFPLPIMPIVEILGLITNLCPNHSFVCKHNSRTRNHPWFHIHNIYIRISKYGTWIWSINYSSLICNLYEPIRNLSSVYTSLCFHPSFCNLHWNGTRRACRSSA